MPARFFVVAVMLLVPSGSAYAATITLDALDRGWYDSAGVHQPALENYTAGLCLPCLAPTGELRNFFIFDLSGVSAPVTSATLRISTRNFSSQDPTETYTVFDVSTSPTSLAGGTGGVAAFNDLGSGVLYGSRIYSEPDQGLLRDILLNASAIAAIERSLGGNFALGGAVTSLSGLYDFEAIFGELANDPGTVSLVLETGRVTAVPEPASMLLLGTGLAGLAARRYRNRPNGIWRSDKPAA